MPRPQVIEDFYGVYLLYCMNPSYIGKTYIGYTRDPDRRIMQHNRGIWAGGALRTNNKGPWHMMTVVHGFPNNISALRFEWAWQNPSKSTRLKHLKLRRKPKETEDTFKLRILVAMLTVGPWKRLPLIIRCDKDLDLADYVNFNKDLYPPRHIPVINGQIKTSKIPRKSPLDAFVVVQCKLCSKNITSSITKLTCLCNECPLVAHITCLANMFLSPGEYIPISGYCPVCRKKLKWGDLIRKMKGCTDRLDEVTSDEDALLIEECDDEI